MDPLAGPGGGLQPRVRRGGGAPAGRHVADRVRRGTRRGGGGPGGGRGRRGARRLDLPRQPHRGGKRLGGAVLDDRRARHRESRGTRRAAARRRPTGARARAGRGAGQHVSRGRPRDRRGRPAGGRLLRRRRPRTAGRADGADHGRRGRRDGGLGRGPRPDTRLSRRRRRRQHERLGPDLSGRSQPYPGPGRGVLGRAPRHTEAVRRSGVRRRALVQPLRPPDLVAAAAGGGERSGAAPDRPGSGGAGRHRASRGRPGGRAGQGGGAARRQRRYGFRRPVHRFQPVPDRLRGAARGPVLPPGNGEPRERDGPPAGPRPRHQAGAASLPAGRRVARRCGRPARPERSGALRRRDDGRAPHPVALGRGFEPPVPACRAADPGAGRGGFAARRVLRDPGRGWPAGGGLAHPAAAGRDGRTAGGGFRAGPEGALDEGNRRRSRGGPAGRVGGRPGVGGRLPVLLGRRLPADRRACRLHAVAPPPPRGAASRLVLAGRVEHGGRQRFAQPGA